MGLISSFAVLQPGLAHQPLLQACCSDSFSGKSYPGLSELDDIVADLVFNEVVGIPADSQRFGFVGVSRGHPHACGITR